MGYEQILLIQRESSYANVPWDIHRELSQGYRSASEAQISSRPISSARANCVHTICEVENCEISAEAARLCLEEDSYLNLKTILRSYVQDELK